MFNPIEAKRRFTEAQIQKSFDSGINLAEEMSLEKAWNVGDEKQYQGVTYYVAGLNAKGKPLWRKKKDGGSAKNQTSTPAPRKPGSVDNKFKNVEFHHGQYYFNMGVDKHNYVILKKLSDKQVAKYKEYQEKRNKDALDAAISQAINDWKNTTNVDTPKKEKAWKNIIDKISVKRAHGYTLTNEENYYWGMEQRGKRVDSKLDSKEKSASSNIRNGIISALKTSQVRLMNSSVGKEERMKMITAVENFMKENPKVDFSNDDLVNIVFGDIDEVKEEYGELKGWNKLKEVQEAYKKVLLSNSTSDPRDKIAQDGGFKDYEEMKGYQDYVTQKNLLKKKSTKAGMRLLYQQEVTKYEKDHADLIKRIG